MEQSYRVRGLNPLGRVIELNLVAPSAEDARKQAEDAGLRYVVVHGVDGENFGERPPPDRPSGSRLTP